MEALSGKVSRFGLNAFTDHALASYILGVAAVEAFVNESLLVRESELLTKGSALWSFRRDWLEKLELRDKIVLVTQLLFNSALDPGVQPLQDLTLLLKVRNEAVHYKRGAPPKFMEEFIKRDIALTSPFRKQHPEAELSQPWAWDLQCTEGIRWAHNTCCRVVHAIVQVIPIEQTEYDRRGVSSVAALDDYQFLHSTAARSAGNFGEISDVAARTFYSSIGLDPDAAGP